MSGMKSDKKLTGFTMPSRFRDDYDSEDGIDQLRDEVENLEKRLGLIRRATTSGNRQSSGLNRVVKQGRIGDVPKASKGPLSGRFLLKGGRGQFIELTSCKALTVLGFKNKAALTAVQEPAPKLNRTSCQVPSGISVGMNERKPLRKSEAVELDEELDAYMAKATGGLRSKLDRELDRYEAARPNGRLRSKLDRELDSYESTKPKSPRVNIEKPDEVETLRNKLDQELDDYLTGKNKPTDVLNQPVPKPDDELRNQLDQELDFYLAKVKIEAEVCEPESLSPGLVEDAAGSGDHQIPVDINDEIDHLDLLDYEYGDIDGMVIDEDFV